MSDLNPAETLEYGEVVPLWRMATEQGQFSSWASGLGAEGNNSNGENFTGFVGRNPPEKAEPAVDQNADIFDVAYKKGWEDGQAALEEEHAASNQNRDALADAIQHLNDLSSPDSYAFILSAVESLFKRCSELAIPDPALLQAWASQLAELVDRDQKGTILVLHPDDIDLIDKDLCKLALRGDETMLRGNLKLSHSGGWIEKGSDVVLDELRTLIDEFSGLASAAGHD
ncbi:hypothetical protein [Parasphingorhabdus sp.]|uniref:hypothetical protein n=1 Tax=Parasphingorhabdus sp. TaxID=2709688 RepID=UPI003A952D95